MKTVIATSLCLLVSLSGCASTTGNLARASAIAIGQNVAPDDITVSDVRRGVTSVEWHASTPTGEYSCSADDMVRRPYCVKP